jgi:hypothetical protein
MSTVAIGQYTRGEASELLSVALALPGAKDWLCGWSHHEIQCGVGCSHPQNNLWACGQYVPGSSDWNPPHHVKNYPSLTAAIAAMVLNLNDKNYPAYQHMLMALRMGDYSSQKVIDGLNTWTGTQGYGSDAANFASEGRAHAGDLFDGSADSGGGGIGPQMSNATCQSSNAGSCKACRGGPGGCPTNEACSIFNSDGSVLPAGLNVPGVCVSNSYVNSNTPTGVINPANPAGNLFNIGIAGWSAARIGKWLGGALLILFGIVLLGAILIDKSEQAPIVRQASKAAALFG